MSITTGTARLTRQQTNQMPALLEFHSPSAALLESRVQGPARGLIWLLAAMFACLTAAAGLIPIDKVVSAPGRVVATQSLVVVQPLETAIVREIDVQEGQVVHKGDLLARLDPTFTSSDQASMTQQAGSLRAEVERLAAEASGLDYNPRVLDQAALVQQGILTQRRAERMFRLENYRQKIAGLQATLAKAVGDVRSYAERKQVATTVEGKRRELERLGWGSQLNSLQAQDQRLEVDRGLQNSQQLVRSAANDLSAMQAEASAYDQDWHAKVSQDLTDQGRKLAEMAGNQQKADLRHNLVDLRADTDATVLSRAPVSVGSVLQSGDKFLTLVPLNAPMELEASVAGGDAGFVHAGNAVTIKFDTFPYTQYGGAKGTVRTVSPDSLSSQQDDGTHRVNSPPNQITPGPSFYRIRVTLDAVDLHDTPPGFHVVPGMPITADVMVGKRTPLSYIFHSALPIAMDGMREP